MRRMNVGRLFAVLGLVLIGTACTSPAVPQSGAGSNSGTITIDGSSALYPLISEATVPFQARNPGIEVVVQGSQSSVGRQGVCTGLIDIGMSDVPLSAQERETWQCQDAVEVPVALQAFAPVANPRGPGSLTSLTTDQLRAIFSGAVTNWQELGGEDVPIAVVHRTQGSGTRDVVMGYLFGDTAVDLAPGALEGGNAEVVRAVSEAPGAIGYLGAAYLDDAPMKVLGVDGVTLTRETVRSRAWPIVKEGYLITKGPGSAPVQAFRAALTDPAFQQSELIQRLGYEPVAP